MEPTFENAERIWNKENTNDKLTCENCGHRSDVEDFEMLSKDGRNYHGAICPECLEVTKF